MPDFHISDEDLARWVRSRPSLIKEFTAEMGQRPALQRLEAPPLYLVIEYFCFDGGIYRREGPKDRPEDRRWEKYSDDILSGKSAWWFWKEVSKKVARELDNMYNVLTLSKNG